MRRLKTIDIMAGAFIVLIGVLAIVESTKFEMGTSRRIGPGYFPFYVGVFMVVLGIVIAIENLWLRPAEGARWQFPPLRSPFLIMAAVAAFALMIERFGLAPAVGTAVFIASLADHNTAIWQKLAVAVAVPLVAVLIFKLGLSLNVDIVRWHP